MVALAKLTCEKKYLANGAQASDSVHNLLVKEGVIDADKRAVKLPEKVVEEASEADLLPLWKEECPPTPSSHSQKHLHLY